MQDPQVQMAESTDDEPAIIEDNEPVNVKLLLMLPIFYS